MNDLFIWGPQATCVSSPPPPRPKQPANRRERICKKFHLLLIPRPPGGLCSPSNFLYAHSLFI